MITFLGIEDFGKCFSFHVCEVSSKTDNKK